MQITKEFLDKEVAAAEEQMALAKERTVMIGGALTVLKQLRVLVEQEEAPECPALPAE